MTDPPVEVIQACVARFHGLEVGEMLRPDKSRRATEIRHDALYLCHLLRSDLSTGAVARLFVLDRSTVRQAWRAAERRAADDPWFGAYIATLRRAIVAHWELCSAKPAAEGPEE